MASPLGHSLISCYFLRPYARVSGKKEATLFSALVLIVLASLPDLDIFVGHWEGLIGEFHRTLTHSFFFALWIGCVIALVESLLLKGPLLKKALLYAALIATHPAVDYFAVIPPYLGAMPLFWPFSGNFYASPVMLLPSAMTYNSVLPMRESLLKTFVGESVLILPLLAYEGAKAWKARARRLETASALGSLQA